MKAAICLLTILAVSWLGVADASLLDFIISKCCSYPIFYRNGLRAICKRSLCACSILTYKCDEGYKVTGTLVNSCENQRWSYRHPTCEEENKCLTTTRPCNRNAKCTPKFNGFTCECKEGYHGDGKRRCDRGCPPPKVPTNVLVSPPPRDGKTYREYAIINFSCKPGYIGVDGRRTSTCLYGSFFNYPPVCLRKHCEPPQAIENGTMSPSSRYAWAAGHTVTYSCNSGFILIGENVSECQSDETYSNPPPNCVVVCEEPVAPGNGTLVNAGKSWIEGDVATMACGVGFTMMGDSTATCTGGNWVPPFNVTCTPEVTAIILDIGSVQPLP